MPENLFGQTEIFYLFPHPKISFLKGKKNRVIMAILTFEMDNI